MTLLEQWRDLAYKQQEDQGKLQSFWQEYFLLEKGIYEQLLDHPRTKITGTVQELADKYKVDLMHMTGFLDGINDSLIEPNPIETMDENTQVNLIYNKEQLFRNMVDAKADWLYDLPQWDKLLGAEKKKQFYLEQKKSGTIHREKKIGRNDPCPCGSGKKYKFCCGKK